MDNRRSKEGRDHETHGIASGPDFESGPTIFGEDRDLNEELRRRLAVLEDPNYEDPAQRNLSLQDFLLLTALVVLTVVVSYAWGV